MCLKIFDVPATNLELLTISNMKVNSYISFGDCWYLSVLVVMGCEVGGVEFLPCPEVFNAIILILIFALFSETTDLQSK